MPATRQPLTEAKRRSYETAVDDTRTLIAAAENELDDLEDELSDLQEALEDGLELQEDADVRERIEKRKLEERAAEIREKGW